MFWVSTKQYPSHIVWKLVCIVLIGLRFLHLTDAIDEPHSWRQCDTANYIYAYYQEGIDLLYPSVCWMGDASHVILEFPLPEAIVALFYQVLGPSHLWARLVFFLFFLWASFFLFRIIRFLFTEQLAWISLVVYLGMPLGLFYSRAIHIDFSAVCCAHAMCDYYLRGFHEKRFLPIIWGTAWATLAFLIKAPYVFYFALPLFYYIHQHKRWKFLLQVSPLLSLPLLVFFLWIRHTHTVNAQMPDWDFIPHYRKFVDNWHWYFGTLHQRQQIDNWMILFNRFTQEVAGRVGVLIAIVGLCTGNWNHIGWNFIRLWLIGVGLYILLFFNLNIIHNYYQIPLLAPIAIGIAGGILIVYRILSSYHQTIARLSMLLLLTLTISEYIYYSESHYYQVDWPQIKAGEYLQSATKSDDLILISRVGLDCRSPHILYRARRKGWTVSDEDIDAELIYRLMGEGAEYVGLIRQAPPSSSLQSFLSYHPEQIFELGEGWQLYLYTIRYEHFLERE